MSTSRAVRTVFVTGANGFIGNAVCRSFIRAGWVVYGLVRRPEAMSELALEEIIPVLGSPADRSFLPSFLKQQPAFDVIVSVTEQWPDYESHFKEVMALIQALADSSNAQGVRPLVIFSSGCKDYGTTGLDGSPGLVPHTEESLLNAPDLLMPRTVNALKVFEHEGSYDAVLMRPTTVYGRSGSYYGLALDLARLAKERDEPLRLPGRAKSIMHGTHVDDCGDAYVAVAEADRAKVAGQCYNVSGRRYETAEEVGGALVRAYGLRRGVVFEPTDWSGFDPLVFLVDFSQWVGSDKIRDELGWRDRRPLFSENIASYRVAFEEFVKLGLGNTQQIGSDSLTARFSKR